MSHKDRHASYGIAKPSPVEASSPIPTSSDSRKRSTRARVSYRDRGVSCDFSEPSSVEDCLPPESPLDSLCIQAESLDENELELLKSTSMALNPDAVSPSTDSYGLQPTILIVDAESHGLVEEAVSTLFTQYDADLARGVDEELCAQFYLNRIHALRTDMWCNKLANHHRNSLMVV